MFEQILVLLIISYSKLSGNYNVTPILVAVVGLYHILNCQGTITLNLEQ